MKKFKLYNLALLALLGGFSSCSEDDDATDQRIVKSVVTIDKTDITLAEGETETVTLTIDKPLNQRSDFKLEIVGGNGSFRDYFVDGDANAETDDETIIDDGYGVIGYKVTLPAYATSSTFDISAVFDLFAEDTEILELRFYSMGNAVALVDENSQNITLTIDNTTSDDVEVYVDWSQEYTDSFGTINSGSYLGADGDYHGFCDFDFDLEVLDGGFGYYDVSYSSCPEHVTIDASAPDDVYYILPSLWELTGSAPAEDLTFDVKVTVAKPGVWYNEIHMNNWNTIDGGAVEGNPDAYVLSHILVKTGTTYDLYDSNSDLVASGRSANIANNFPKKKSK